MVLDLLTIAGIPASIGTFEAVAQQHVLDEDALSDERQAEFYLDVYCDAKSSKKDEVHGTMVVLRNGKLCLWPKDSKTGLPKKDEDGSKPPHPFTGFYYPFPDEKLPERPSPSAPMLGLVSTLPPPSFTPRTSDPEVKPIKPKLNWIYIDKETMELKYGPRRVAKDHVIGPWDWTDDDEQGLTIQDQEMFVAVENEKGGYDWEVYCDPKDDRLKDFDIGKRRVLRCSLERRLLKEPEIQDLV